MEKLICSGNVKSKKLNLYIATPKHQSKIMLALTIVICSMVAHNLLACGLQLQTSTSNQSAPYSSPFSDELDSNNRLLASSTATTSATSSEPMATESFDSLRPLRPNEQNDESQEGSDLNFTLMNAPHDKIQAVKHLINSQRSSQQDTDQSSGASISGHSGQCTNRGRVYLNGQRVPIEDQPCLNCTCRRAIVQCDLRVCPPVISLEGHRRMQAMTSYGSDGSPQKCRMVKEPHQCCATMRCEPERAIESVIPTSSPQDSEYSSAAGAAETRSGSSTGDMHTSNSDTNTVSLSTAEDNQGSRIMTIKDENERGLVLRIQASAESPSNRSINEMPAIVFSTTPSYNSRSNNNNNNQDNNDQKDGNNLPKLTVIKGPSGQRDSILLITSNPNSQHLPRDKMHQDSTSLGPNGNRDYSNALLDTLLETVYSSVAQLNGLSLQGSCMINGSLYVEGSAVIPEGNAYCQYCYCIRQKIMCIKPKCHLMISGCTPKYSNEYACCPTSYSCSSQDMSPIIGGSSRNSLSGSTINQARLTSSNEQSHSLSAKLSAAIESLSRLSYPERPNHSSTDLQANQRQVDRSLNPESPIHSAAALALYNAVLSAANETTSGSANSTALPSSSTTTTTTTTSTSTSTSTTSTTTSTPAPARMSAIESRSPNVSNKEKEEIKRAEAEGNDEEGDEDNAESDDKKPESGANKKASSSNEASNVTSERPSQLSAFLEPMNKLGPLVMPPSAPSSCTENGRQYGIGEQIPTLESCKHCYCAHDGIKECKMIECSLKIAHNCKPITPEGHCCPIRYDCPMQYGQANHQSRQRSEPSAGKAVDPVGLAPFKDVSQCKSDTGVGDDCSSNILNQQSLNEQANGSLDNIPGIISNDTPSPILKTTRFIDDSNESATPTSWPQSSTTLTNENATGTPLSLTEELNKFIMQINQNTTQGTGYSLVSNLSDTTQEMMINDQHSRMVDYHSVQAPTVPASPLISAGQSNEPEPLRNLMKGGRVLVTNGQIMPAERATSSSVEYSTDMHNGQRDSRSTNEQRFPPNELLADITRINAPEPVNASTFSSIDQPEAYNISDDYIDTDPATNSTHARKPTQSSNLNASEIPHMRLMRNNHQAEAPFHRVSPVPLVVFDDSLSLNNPDQQVNGTQDLSLINQTEPLNNNSSLLPKVEDAPQPTTGTPIGLDLDRAPETRGWLKSLSGLVNSFGRRLSGSSNAANRLQSGRNFELDGLASATGSEQLNGEPREAATGRSKQQSLFNQLLEMISKNEHIVPVPAKNLVMRPLAGVMQVAPSSDEAPELTPTTVFLNNHSRAKPMSPYEPGISASSSEVELVTAAVPIDLDALSQEQTANRGSILPADRNTFSRRSDVNEDELFRDTTNSRQQINVQPVDTSDVPQPTTEQPTINRNTFHKISKQIATVKVQNQARTNQKALTCYDFATNKTYQLNEIIAKDDPCKTCTCILGEELCQNLVCPEKPAENCNEERRPGECCANYLCGNNVTQLTNPAEQPVRSSQVVATNARMMAPTNQNSAPPIEQQVKPGQLIATQRALHISPDPAPSFNNLDRNLQRPLFSAPQSQQVTQQHFQRPQMQQFNAPISRNVQADTTNRQQLPQHPIRLNELAGILPPHLRFRPREYQALPNQMSPNNVLFSNQKNFAQQVNPGLINSAQPLANRRNDGFVGISNARMPAAQAMNQFNHRTSTNPIVNQGILMHPQRSSSSLLPFGPSSSNSAPVLKQRIDEPILSTANALNVWQSSSTEQSLNMQQQNNRLPSLVMTRLQVPNQLVSSDNQANETVWRPSNGFNHMQTQQPNQDSSSSIQPSPLVNVNEPQVLVSKSPDYNTAAAPPLSRSKPAIESNEVGGNVDRVIFQNQPGDSQFGSNLNAVDLGFKPIVPIAVTQRTTDLHNFHSVEPDRSIAITTVKDEGPTDGSISSQSIGFDSTSTQLPTDRSNPNQMQNFSPTESAMQVISTKTTEQATDQTRDSVSTPIVESTTKELPIDTTSFIPSTTKQSLDDEAVATPNKAHTDTTSAPSNTQSNNESAGFDPMAMFRVSECNIYGRIYPVGHTIEELSDTCKRCTCTSMGVECQNKCR